MPAFAKIPYLQGLPTTNLSRRHSASSTIPGAANQLVLAQLQQYPTPPTRNEHIVAILAHTRGVPGQGCARVGRGGVCQFQDTVVFTGLIPGRQTRVLNKCTNCHFAADGTQCGAVLVGGGGNLPPPLPPPQVQATSL